MNYQIVLLGLAPAETPLPISINKWHRLIKLLISDRSTITLFTSFNRFMNHRTLHPAGTQRAQQRGRDSQGGADLSILWKEASRSSSRFPPAFPVSCARLVQTASSCDNWGGGPSPRFPVGSGPILSKMFMRPGHELEAQVQTQASHHNVSRA